MNWPVMSTNVLCDRVVVVNGDLIHRSSNCGSWLAGPNLKAWGRFDDMHIARICISNSAISLTGRDLHFTISCDLDLLYDRKASTYEQCLSNNTHNA